MKNTSASTYIYWIIGVVIFGGLFLWAVSKYSTPAGPAPLDDFAKCLTEKGVVFYGAFWCPHCQNQKKLFGDSIQYIDYVECSTPDAKGQLKVCQDKKIEGYPTFEFSDGSREDGEVSLEKLSEKTSCPLPGAQVPVVASSTIATSTAQ